MGYMWIQWITCFKQTKALKKQLSDIYIVICFKMSHHLLWGHPTKVQLAVFGNSISYLCDVFAVLSVNKHLHLKLHPQNGLCFLFPFIPDGFNVHLNHTKNVNKYSLAFSNMCTVIHYKEDDTFAVLMRFGKPTKLFCASSNSSFLTTSKSNKTIIS